MPESIPLHDGGTLIYDRAFYPPDEASSIFATLQSLEWEQAFSRGKPFPRLTAYFADTGIDYSYSGVRHPAKPWPPLLLAMKQRVEHAAEATFNSVLLNRYRHNRDSMGFHSDYDSQVGPNPVIASVTFGGVRRFVLKHLQTGEKIELELASGSLLVMGGTSQHFYHHAVPKTARPVEERINLTFRWLGPKSVGG